MLTIEKHYFKVLIRSKRKRKDFNPKQNLDFSSIIIIISLNPGTLVRRSRCLLILLKLSMKQDFSYCTCSSAGVDFGHVLGNDMQETD